MTFAKNLLKTSIPVTLSAAVGTAVTDPDTRWYKRLDKPEIQPPTAVFPIAWTALYGTIAVASAKALTAAERITRPGPEDPMPTPSEREETVKQVRGFKRALGLKLVLNTGWSALFWQGRNLPVAAVEAGLLALSPADLARRAGRLDRASGALLLPYAGWTAFATVLTTRIEQEN